MLKVTQSTILLSLFHIWDQLQAKVVDRHKTWDTHHSLAGTSALPWLAIGDFNKVLHQLEHDKVGLKTHFH